MISSDFGREGMLRRIVNIVYAFNGRVNGDYVINVVRDSIESVKEIECSLPTQAMRFVKPMLQLEYDVEDKDYTTLVLKHRAYAKHAVDFKYVAYDPQYSSSSLNPSKIEFDIDLLCMSKCSLHVRRNQEQMDLNTLMHRVRKQMFSIIETDKKSETSHEHAAAINRASELIKQGWKQDTKSSSKPTWVVTKWANVKNLPLVHCHKKFSALVTQCAICCESFESEDVIINLSCNHNFHISCHKKWLETGNMTCPCCRDSIRFACTEADEDVASSS